MIWNTAQTVMFNGATVQAVLFNGSKIWPSVPSTGIIWSAKGTVAGQPTGASYVAGYFLPISYLLTVSAVPYGLAPMYSASASSNGYSQSWKWASSTYPVINTGVTLKDVNISGKFTIAFRKSSGANGSASAQYVYGYSPLSYLFCNVSGGEFNGSATDEGRRSGSGKWGPSTSVAYSNQVTTTFSASAASANSYVRTQTTPTSVYDWYVGPAFSESIQKSQIRFSATWSATGIYMP